MRIYYNLYTEDEEYIDTIYVEGESEEECDWQMAEYLKKFNTPVSIEKEGTE